MCCCSHTRSYLFRSCRQPALPSSSQLEMGVSRCQTTCPPHQRARWPYSRTLTLESGCSAHALGTGNPHGGQGIGPPTQVSVCAAADQWKGHPTEYPAVQQRVALRPLPQLPPLPQPLLSIRQKLYLSQPMAFRGDAEGDGVGPQCDGSWTCSAAMDWKCSTLWCCVCHKSLCQLCWRVKCLMGHLSALPLGLLSWSGATWPGTTRTIAASPYTGSQVCSTCVCGVCIHTYRQCVYECIHM